MQKAVFLDRDGALVYDLGYLSDPEKLRILPKVVEGLEKIKSLGFLTIIISNQSGVARGYFKLKEMRLFDAKLKKILNKKQRLLDDSFYCPHHPDFDKKCSCRKPKIGLLKKAQKKYNLDISNSFFVGDKMKDILCGKNIGCKTILMPKNLEKLAVIEKEVKPDYIAIDLLDAASWIEKDISKQSSPSSIN